MTSLSRIARLAKIPEIRKKKRDTDPRKKKHDDKSEEDRPVFPLKGNMTIKKPRTMVQQQPQQDGQTPPRSADDGIGERLDLKV